MCLKARQGFKYTLFILHFTVQIILGLKMTDYEKKNVTGGWGWGWGVREVPKKCHVLVEWPLTIEAAYCDHFGPEEKLSWAIVYRLPNGVFFKVAHNEKLRNTGQKISWLTHFRFTKIGFLPLSALSYFMLPWIYLVISQM